MTKIENNGALPFFTMEDFVIGHDFERTENYVIHTQSPRFIAAYGDFGDLDQWFVGTFDDSDANSPERYCFKTIIGDLEIRTIRWDDPKPSPEEIQMLLRRAAGEIENMIMSDEECEEEEVVSEAEARFKALSITNDFGQYLPAFGKEMFGEEWEEPLAKHLDVDAALLRSWLSGDVKVPEEVVFKVVGF